MNIILLEQIFHRLDWLNAVYCCILCPFLINIKSSKNIYLSSKSSNNFVTSLSYIKYFSNFNFDLLLHKHDFLNFNFKNLSNLRITLDFLDHIELEAYTSNLCRSIELLQNSLKNLSGIQSLEFHIPKYYKLKNNELFIDNIAYVLITTHIPINKIKINNVTNFILNDATLLNTFEFDDKLKNLSLFKINVDILKNIKSDNINTLLLNGCYLNNNINFKDQFPNLKHLQLDFSKFSSDFDLSSIVGNYNSLSLNYTSMCYNYNNKQFEDYSSFKNLKSLQLNGNSHINKILGFNGNNLSLDFSDNIQVFNFQNLESLYLQYNKFITGKDTELFKNIKTIDLSGTNIEYLSENITNLQNFIGQACKNLTIFPSYRELDTVNLNSCYNLEKINTLKIKTLFCNDCPKLKN